MLIGNLFDEDAPICRPDLVIELLQEAQADKAIDAIPGREIEHVNAEVWNQEAERRDPKGPQRVALLLADRRAHDGDMLAIPGAITETIDDVRCYDCF